MADEERKAVKAEELITEERLTILHYYLAKDYPALADFATFRLIAHAVLAGLGIAAIIPYTAGPCHRGFNKHPYDKCPDLEHAGCPYITMPGCFFQDGAVLVRKPRTPDEARQWKPPAKNEA